MAKPAKQSAMREMAPFMNLGMELCASMAGAGLLGWFIDKTFDTQPTWLVILLILGIIGGMTRFIRTALSLSTKNSSKAKVAVQHKDSPVHANDTFSSHSENTSSEV